MSAHLRQAWQRVAQVSTVTYRVEERNQGYSDHQVEVTADGPGGVVGSLLAFYRWGFKAEYESTWYIWRLWVDDDHRRQGIAEGMLLALHDAFPEHLIIHGGFSSVAGEQYGQAMVRKYPRWNRLSRKVARMYPWVIAYEGPEGGGYYPIEAESFAAAVRQFRLMFGTKVTIVYVYQEESPMEGVGL